MAINDGKLSRATWVVLAGSMALSFYFMITYSGPFQWFAELQLRWWSSYSENLTFILTFLLLTGAGALLAWPYQRGAGKSATPSAEATAGEAAQARPGFWARLGEAGQMGVYAMAVGAIVAGLGLRDMWRLAGNAELADVSVAQLEAGEAPPSRWVNLAAVPVVEAAVTFKSSRDKDEDTYVPLLSEDYDPAAGVRAFAKYDGDETSPPTRMQPSVIEGLIAPGGLPGPVRAEYERVGMLRAGQTYYLLEPGKDPATQRELARNTTGIGAAIVGGGAVLMGVGFAWTRRRERRLALTLAPPDRAPV